MGYQLQKGEMQQLFDALSRDYILLGPVKRKGEAKAVEGFGMGCKVSLFL